MAFHTFGAMLAYDPSARRGIAGTVGKAVDKSNGVPVETFDMDGNPAPVVTNASGYVDYFKVDESIDLIEVTFGGHTMLMVAIELLALAREATETIEQFADRINAAEIKNALQDERLTGIEKLQPIKSVRLENGKWVWDTNSGTHFVLIDSDGNPAVRATPWPVPNKTTPTFTW